MIRTTLHLKTSSELLTDLENYLNDSGNALATEAQYYNAINRALGMWGPRVRIPHLYEFDFAAGIFDYALPTYIRPPLHIEIRKAIFGLHGVQLDLDSTFSWQDFVAYDIKPNGTGGFDLHLHSYPYAESGRITWFAENGPLATGTINSEAFTSTATQVEIEVPSGTHINDFGYAKFEEEWCAYAGATRTTSTAFILHNLVRGLYGSSAANHDVTTVLWGVGVDDMRLWQQLLDRAGAFIHMLNMHKSTVEDTNRHEKLYVAMRDEANRFWNKEGYVSQAAPRFVLKRGALGPMPWT